MSGGGKGAKSPKAPDYTALAQQQGSINQQTAQQLTQANRPNQIDPFGNSITWSQQYGPEYQQAVDALNNYDQQVAAHPNWAPDLIAKDRASFQAKVDAAKGNATWTQQQSLNPETKAAWETYMRNANQASSSFGDILNKYLSGYTSPDAQGSDDAFANALYGSVMDRGRVEQQRESDALTAQLRNSGLQPGSEAYDRAMKNLMTSQNDANLLASQNAVLAGRQEYRNSRNQPLQEIAGIAGVAGGQPYTPTYQGFSGATGYNPTDLVGAAQAQYGAKQNAANASNSKKGGLLGAGASLGGSFLGSK